jgi:hypothetical protein
MTAHLTRTTFRQVVGVAAEIDAATEHVWARLTDAHGFAPWNSTVETIEGTIAPGERLTIRVPAAPGRTFRPRVVQFDPPTRMVWRDGALPMFRGTRTFLLESLPSAQTRFTMTEQFEGLLLPMIARALPDFVAVFEQYAGDLRTECEKSAR